MLFFCLFYRWNILVRVIFAWVIYARVIFACMLTMGTVLGHKMLGLVHKVMKLRGLNSCQRFIWARGLFQCNFEMALDWVAGTTAVFFLLDLCVGMVFDVFRARSHIVCWG